MTGTEIADWAVVEGAYYAGQGGEALWLILSFALCTVALIIGSLHEKRAYRKAE